MSNLSRAGQATMEAVNEARTMAERVGVIDIVREFSRHAGERSMLSKLRS